MRQAAGALLRQGLRRAGGGSAAQRAALWHTPRKQWLACIPSSSSSPRIPPVQSFHAAHFSSAAAVNSNSSSKDTKSAAAEDNAANSAAAAEAEPVCKSGKDDKKVGAAKDGGKVSSGSGKDENGKGGEETAEQKLLKEIKKLEQLLRERESLLEEKDEIAKELKDNVLRSYAELENYRDRARREQESSRKFAVQSFSKDLLDVSDNLSRALSSVGQTKDLDEAKKVLHTLIEGVKMTEKQLMTVLKKYGIERFDPMGEPFDPNVHLAICEVADPSKPAGTVANVFKVGYLLHERVLRPAEVAVVKAVEAAA